MYEFLTSSASSLVKTMATHPRFCGLVKVLVLLMIFYKCEMLNKFSSTKSNCYNISNLLKNLAVRDESSYQLINTNLLDHYHKSIMDILEKLIYNAAKSNPPIIEWIFAVPLLHFMLKKCKPFEQLDGTSVDYDHLTKQVYI